MRALCWCLVVLILASSSVGCRKLFPRKSRADAGAGAGAGTAELGSTDRFDVELGDLRVVMPGPPKTATTREPSDAGEVIVTRHEVTVGDSYFVASVVDVPDAKAWSSEASVNGAIEKALASMRGQEGTKQVRSTRERPVTIGDMTGRDVSAVVERSDGTTLHTRLLSVSRTRRNYFLLAVVPSSDDDPLVKKMFASLKPAKP